MVIILIFKDELLWAAAWLYEATNDEYYLKYVVDNAVYLGGTGWSAKEFSWDNKYAGVQILLTKVSQIKEFSEEFVPLVLQRNMLDFDPLNIYVYIYY